LKVAVIIPAWNESKHIFDVVKRTKKVISDVIVIDDGSCDNTSERAKLAGATVLTHIVNLGKGSAAKTGCDYAYKKRFDVLILMDADGQHLPEDIPKFLKALKKKEKSFTSIELISILESRLPFRLHSDTTSHSAILLCFSKFRRS
jgi:glycosyltransferase involved in cell wall biosynthesis